MNLLLIEDSKVDVAAVLGLLSRVEYESIETVCENSLKTACQRVAEVTFDVVLLDLGLPDSFGLDTFVKLQPCAPDIPIVVLTGLDDERTACKAVELGAQDYLVKGQLTKNLLIRSLRYGIQRKRSEKSLRETNRRLDETLRQLQQAQERLVQQERLSALGQMSVGVAHNFNNLLTPIQGYCEILMQTPLQISQKKFVELIQRSSVSATRVVQRLFQAFAEERKTSNLKCIHLDELVKEAISITEPRWKDQTKSSEFSIRLNTDLQPVPPIAVEEPAFVQVLVNLLFNAADALPKGGGIRIAIRDGGENVILEVCDTGVGMTEEVRRACVDPFFSTKSSVGVGLGLTVVDGFVRQHQGVIEIESQRGKGTTIRIQLPKQIQPRNLDQKASKFEQICV